MSIVLSDDPACINWSELAVVFQRAPLGNRDPDTLRTTFVNSGVRCFAFDGSVIVGAGRSITDHVRYAMVLDVVVLPEYQGQGIGTKIMTHLADRSGAENLVLHAAPGKEAFYELLGYRRMKTAMARFADPESKRQLGYIE